jgi:hypothetical protein
MQSRRMCNYRQCEGPRDSENQTPQGNSQESPLRVL